MNLLITSKEQILAELTNIDSFLNITMSEDVAEAVQRGNDDKCSSQFFMSGREILS